MNIDERNPKFYEREIVELLSRSNHISIVDVADYHVLAKFNIEPSMIAAIFDHIKIKLDAPFEILQWHDFKRYDQRIAQLQICNPPCSKGQFERALAGVDLFNKLMGQLGRGESLVLARFKPIPETEEKEKKNNWYSAQYFRKEKNEFAFVENRGDSPISITILRGSLNKKPRIQSESTQICQTGGHYNRALKEVYQTLVNEGYVGAKLPKWFIEARPNASHKKET